MECDVCSKILLRTELPGYIELYAVSVDLRGLDFSNDIASLNSLDCARSSWSLPEGTCDDDTDDSGSECSITGEDALTDGGDQSLRPKPV